KTLNLDYIIRLICFKKVTGKNKVNIKPRKISWLLFILLFSINFLKFIENNKINVCNPKVLLKEKSFFQKSLIN
ncbi:hypothetical protein, partial [Borreliella garinii]|uniref:hypothetical protein n=1 Tax=Borreliella garinii TaxID=29519 RepID=UPI001AEF8539